MNPRRSTLPLLLALLALVVVLAIFWARNRSRGGEPQESGTGTAAASTPGTARSSAPPAASASPTPAGLSSSAAAETGSSPASPKPSSAALDQQDTSAVQPKPSGQPSPSAAQSPDHPFSVVVTAKEDAWVTLSADGRTVISRVLNAGEQQSFRAGKRIVLTTGNAGGLDVSFNGKDLGAIGNESQVRTLTFVPTGLVQ